MYPCEFCGLPRDGKSKYDNSGLKHDCVSEVLAKVRRLEKSFAECLAEDAEKVKKSIVSEG